MIKENIEKIQNEILLAKQKSPYDQDVTLIAVSKTKSEEEIMEAYSSGIRDFGENKVQELTLKMNALPKDIRWHMIGHLQTNKVKYIVGRTCLIHSVDSLKLARAIEEQAEKKDVFVDVLVQVNISKEESKFGISAKELPDFLKSVSALPRVRVRGLMTIAPESDDYEKCRPVFRELRNLSIDINSLKLDNIRMDFLSMGMSGDFAAAIEEGSDMVRIGTGIFGKRIYT